MGTICVVAKDIASTWAAAEAYNSRNHTSDAHKAMHSIVTGTTGSTGSKESKSIGSSNSCTSSTDNGVYTVSATSTWIEDTKES